MHMVDITQNAKIKIIGFVCKNAELLKIYIPYIVNTLFCHCFPE